MQASELLIYDRDCAFCNACLRWGKKNLTYLPKSIGYQDLDLSKYQLTQADGERSIWLIQENGDALPANLAVAAILRRQPNYLWRLVGSLMNSYWIKPVAKNIYYWVAANRSKLPGGTEDCDLTKK